MNETSNWTPRPKTLKDLLVVPEGVTIKFNRRGRNIEANISFCGIADFFSFDENDGTDRVAESINFKMQRLVTCYTNKARNLSVLGE